MRSKLGREFGGFSPLAVFGVLVIVVAALGAAVLLFQPDADPADPAPRPEGSQPGEASEREDDLRLTNAEAIARFKELDALRLRAYAEADIRLLPRIFTRDSSIYRVVRKEIRVLDRDDVRSLTVFRTKSLRVLEAGPNEIRLRQVVIKRPKFVDASGRDVTGHARPQRQVIDWVLRREAVWLLHSASVVSTELVTGETR